jgi:hypothetical protein
LARKTLKMPEKQGDGAVALLMPSQKRLGIACAKVGSTSTSVAK